MRKKEALEMQKLMIEWCMYHEGIKTEKPEPFPIEWTLEMMIQANKKVAEHNKVQSEKPFVNNKRKTTRYLTIDDRAIAALYVAFNYEGQKGDSNGNASSIACANGNFVYVINEMVNI